MAPERAVGIDPVDDLANATVAAGALWMVLDGDPKITEVALDPEHANGLLIRLAFLRSVYRVTVTITDLEAVPSEAIPTEGDHG